MSGVSELLNIMKIIYYFSLLFLHWTPRILTLLFILVISMLSFDVFGQSIGFWKTLLQLLMHLVPAFLVILILVLSWRWAWIGGIVYILLGIAFLIWQDSPSAIIYIPLFIMGGLFVFSWFMRKDIKRAQEAYWERY